MISGASEELLASGLSYLDGSGRLASLACRSAVMND